MFIVGVDIIVSSNKEIWGNIIFPISRQSTLDVN